MVSLLIFLERTTIGADGVQTVEIAAVEREQTVSRYEAQGYRRCSAAEFCAAWQQRDRQVLRRRRASVLTALAEQQQDMIATLPESTRSYPPS
jgi:hypothetical protein